VAGLRARRGAAVVGAAAAREGVFAAAGTLASRAPGGAATLLVVLLLLDAVVTAVLNLDTAVVFMTPVLLHAARHRGVPDGPFLYGAVFMANSASILLPGSNLTNLIVLQHEHVTGSTFAARLAPLVGGRGHDHDRVRPRRVPARPIRARRRRAGSRRLPPARRCRGHRCAARPSILRYTLLGVVLVPLSLGLSLLAVRF